MKIMIIATTESRAVSMPNMKFSTPNRISPAIPTAKPPAQRVMPDAVLTIADNTFHNAFPMSFNVILISSNFKLLLLLSCSDGRSGRVIFLFASPYVRCSLVTSSDRASVVFVSGASQRSGFGDARFAGQNTT